MFIVFGCLFLYILLYYGSGYLAANEVAYLYVQKDCSTLTTLASATTKIFPESIVPASRSVRLRREECSLYLKAESLHTQGTWPEAYKEYDRYMKAYPGGIYLEEARSAGADSLFRWATDQRADQDYAGAETNLFILLEKYDANVQPSDVKQTLAEIYVEWAASLLSDKKYAEAEKYYNEAIKSDPNPGADNGPAEQARVAVPELHRTWAKDLLAAKNYKDAVEHFKTAVKLLGAGKSEAVSDELAQAYLLWAKSQSLANDHYAALDTINLAEQAASSAPAKEQATTARTDALNTFSKSSGTQAQDLMNQAAKTVCTNKTAAAPRVPILGADPNKQHVLLYGLNFTLSASVGANNPGAAYYVACVNVNQRTVQSCPYTGGYTIKRVAVDWVIEVRALLTGKIYRQTTLNGGSPESCPSTHLFTRGVFTISHTGQPPTQSALETWLAKFIK